MKNNPIAETAKDRDVGNTVGSRSHNNSNNFAPMFMFTLAIETAIEKWYLQMSERKYKYK